MAGLFPAAVSLAADPRLAGVLLLPTLALAGAGAFAAVFEPRLPPASSEGVGFAADPRLPLGALLLLPLPWAVTGALAAALDPRLTPVSLGAVGFAADPRLPAGLEPLPPPPTPVGDDGLLAYAFVAAEPRLPVGLLALLASGLPAAEPRLPPGETPANDPWEGERSAAALEPRRLEMGPSEVKSGCLTGPRALKGGAARSGSAMEEGPRNLPPGREFEGFKIRVEIV